MQTKAKFLVNRPADTLSQGVSIPTRISVWIKENELLVYFVVAYTISWSFMLPVALSAQGILKLQVPYALYYLASTGPALIRATVAC
jgi:hypothetical protein